MKIFHQLVFDDSVEGTTAVYTNPEWNDLLAMTEVIVLAVYATQVSGTSPTLTMRSQVSGDGRTWTNLAGTPELNAQTLDTAAQTSLTAWTAATDAVAGFRRLEITLGGTTPKAHLRIYVTGRQTVPTNAPDYLWLKRGGSAQTGITTNTKIDLNSVGPIRGVSYDSVNSLVLLNPGKTYRLTLSGYLENFSAADGSIQVKFMDDANNPLTNPTADAPTAMFRPQTGTTQSGQSSGCEMIYVVAPDASMTVRQVKLRVSNASGTADVPQNGLTWIVEEISGGV